MIILANDLGSAVGWLGFGVYFDADLLAATGNISGYPGCKPGGTQWYASRKTDTVNSRKVYYAIDSAGGQSGSAVYRIINVAAMPWPCMRTGGATTNSGTRIVSPVYNNMVTWKA